MLKTVGQVQTRPCNIELSSTRCQQSPTHPIRASDIGINRSLGRCGVRPKPDLQSACNQPPLRALSDQAYRRSILYGWADRGRLLQARIVFPISRKPTFTDKFRNSATEWLVSGQNGHAVGCSELPKRSHSQSCLIGPSPIPGPKFAIWTDSIFGRTMIVSTRRSRFWHRVSSHSRSPCHCTNMRCGNSAGTADHPDRQRKGGRSDCDLHNGKARWKADHCSH